MNGAAGGRRWTACGASVTGSEHRRRGLGCDDAYSYGILGDFAVATVADGAGSVTGTSAWGAYVACRGVLKDAMNPAFIDSYSSGSSTDAEILVRVLFDGALHRVRRQAEAMGLDVALLSTTLSVAVTDTRLATFAQIGDGIIATERDGVIETLLAEHKQEYANTTSFLQSEGALEGSLRTAGHEDVTAIALSTDGMSYKITDVTTGAAYQPFFRGSWQHLRDGAQSDQLQAMLDGIRDDQTGDDKTLVLVARCADAEWAGTEALRWAHSGSPGSPPGSAPSVTVGRPDDATVTDSGAGRSRSRSRWGRWLR
ncbi:PP2C family serine/threonine-protein phosphatase [Mycolicibacter acidiphilus]|uniref:PP2C family serine/threonine-protein phosphatase n=1 Tax=Mycolicibacter acidiphilus TaxID=2835306 RepID=UPI0027DBD09A|nr:PP2C family serine/threonine-protein phosphatase [Mycolicibacter acidiphilus]